MKRLAPLERLSLALLAVTAIVLVGMHNPAVGWWLFTAGVAMCVLTRHEFRKYILLIFGALAILGLVPITTDITNENFLRMGAALGLAVILPYSVSRYVYHEKVVNFRFRNGRRWMKSEVFYIVFTAVVSYFLLPFYLRTSGAYTNWGVDATTESITRLFIGTNALGIWDELFFVSTVLGVLRRYLPFAKANLLQAILFTSFLYELGFTGWGPFMIFPFALLQGYVFKKSDSLFYVIAIHLTLDFVLFLSLINAHHPELANIFIT